MILTFFLCIKILIVTPLAIQYSQNVFRGISILVCIGVQVLFPFLQSSSRAWFALLSSFALASVWPKNAEKLPVLQIQSSSMKLRVHGFLFLVFLHIKADGKNKLFYDDIKIQIWRFFIELVESKSCRKYCLIIIQIGANLALISWPFSYGCKLMITKLKLLTTLQWTIFVFFLSRRLMLNRV